MELTNHSLFGGKGVIALPNPQPIAQVPEWASLQARFAAAHAARRELLRMAAEGPARSGGFERWVAGAPERRFTDVNPVGLADGKRDAAMTGSMDSTTHTGDRGNL
jgi:hypothetical protein